MSVKSLFDKCITKADSRKIKHFEFVTDSIIHEGKLTSTIHLLNIVPLGAIEHMRKSIRKVHLNYISSSFPCEKGEVISSNMISNCQLTLEEYLSLKPEQIETILILPSPELENIKVVYE